MKINNKNIILLTGDIRSGKTTKAEKWLEDHPEAAGVISPDINDIRCLRFYPERKTAPFQTFDDNKKDVTKIGRYTFLNESFEMAKNFLLDSDGLYPWIVIDEYGKLEMEGEGFEPAVSALLHSEKEGNIIVVIRKNLLDAFCEKFNLIPDKNEIIFSE